MGNLRSVEKALERVGAEAALTADPARRADADGLVLPGRRRVPEGDGATCASSGSTG